MVINNKFKKITIQPTSNQARTINLKEDSQVVELIDINRAKEQNTKIKIAANTIVDYIFLLDKKVNTNFFENRRIEVGENAVINSWYCYLGGAKNKINLDYQIQANAKVKYKTIFLAKNNQEFNFNDNYQFLFPGANGEFSISGVLKNNAKSSSVANIIVNQKAAKIK